MQLEGPQSCDHTRALLSVYTAQNQQHDLSALQTLSSEIPRALAPTRAAYHEIWPNAKERRSSKVPCRGILTPCRVLTGHPTQRQGHCCKGRAWAWPGAGMLLLHKQRLGRWRGRAPASARMRQRASLHCPSWFFVTFVRLQANVYLAVCFCAGRQRCTCQRGRNKWWSRQNWQCSALGRTASSGRAWSCCCHS